MPAGTVTDSVGIVNTICPIRMVPSAYDAPSNSDRLEGLNILIKFIIGQKQEKIKKRKKRCLGVRDSLV